MPTLFVGMFDSVRETRGMTKQAWPWHPAATLSATETNLWAVIQEATHRCILIIETLNPEPSTFLP